MPQFLFDTDHLTLLENRHARVVQLYSAQPPGTVGVSAVSIEEAMRGRLAAVSRAQAGARRIHAYALLVITLVALRQFVIVPYDPASDTQFQQLLAQRLRIGTQDLRIAAIALVHKLILVTCNRRDFGRVAGIGVEDWSV